MEALFNRFHEQLAQCGYVAMWLCGVCGTLVLRWFGWTNDWCYLGRSTQTTQHTRIKHAATNWRRKTPIPPCMMPAPLTILDTQTDIIQFFVKNDNNLSGVGAALAAIYLGFTAKAAPTHMLFLMRNGINGAKCPIYADSAYHSTERETALAQQNITSQICEKGSRGNLLSCGRRSKLGWWIGYTTWCVWCNSPDAIG